MECEGQVLVKGNEYNVESTDSLPDAFTCYLDTELAKLVLEIEFSWSCTELRMEAFLFLTVPNNYVPMIQETRSQMQKYIRHTHGLGQNIANYMSYLMEEDEDTYKKQFSYYIKNNVT